MQMKHCFVSVCLEISGNSLHLWPPHGKTMINRWVWVRDEFPYVSLCFHVQTDLNEENSASHWPLAAGTRPEVQRQRLTPRWPSLCALRYFCQGFFVNAAELHQNIGPARVTFTPAALVICASASHDTPVDFAASWIAAN